MKSWVIEYAGVARSSYYFKPSLIDGRKNNSGRKPPGFTINRDRTVVMDTTIEILLRSYRERVEYSNAAGVRKLKHMLRRDHGIYVNEKRVYQICRRNNLLLTKRKKKKGLAHRTVASNRQVNRPNQVWGFDIKYGYVDGERRFFFVLAFIDVFTRKVVGDYVGLSCRAGDLCFTLKEALLREGVNEADQLVIRSDNGPQMTSKEFSSWLSKLEKELMHEFIPVQMPNKNAHIESFFSILEIEFLSVTYFASFAEAYEKTKAFIRFYNQERIHGSIGYITPTEAMEKFKRGELLNVDTISM